MGDDTRDPVVFDRAAGFYDATRGFPPGVERDVAALLADAGGLGPESRVLEVGIGTGRIALPLAAHVGHVVGVDLSAPMLRQLLERRGTAHVGVARADAARLPFATASFDAAVGVHVFHLIPAWREALAEIARVLRPGGALLHAADQEGSLGLSAHRLAAELGYENAGVPRDRLETFLEEEGWRPAPVRRIDFTRSTTPRTLLDRMSTRSWSVTWQMTDADLARVVERLRAELIRRYGALDRPIEMQTGFWVRRHLPPG